MAGLPCKPSTPLFQKSSLIAMPSQRPIQHQEAVVIHAGVNRVDAWWHDGSSTAHAKQGNTRPLQPLTRNGTEKPCMQPITRHTSLFAFLRFAIPDWPVNRCIQQAVSQLGSRSCSCPSFAMASSPTLHQRFFTSWKKSVFGSSRPGYPRTNPDDS